MLRNYFKIAWRNIVKHRFYAVVNIIGLSTGIAFTLLIAAYVWSEWQVNKHLKQADRQYIIQSKWKNPNEGFELASIGALAKALKENYPHLVANYYRYDGVTSNVSKGNKSFREGIQIGDSTLLTMYGFKLLYGDNNTALNEPFTAVITTGKAIKYFGKTDVVGQTITIENFSGAKHDFKITGVMQTPAMNSVTHLNEANNNQFYIAASNLNFFGRDMSWQNPFIACYIQLQKGITPKDLEQPIARLMKQHAPPLFVSDLSPYLVALHDYYFVANNSLVKKMVYALSAIALFILLMAVINFINMAVSRAAARMREIGIQKVLGGLKKQLVSQFLVESILLVFFATAVAFILYGATGKLLSNILGKDIPVLSDFPIYFVLFPVFFVLILGVVAGIYPAFVLSSLKSVESLKGKLSAVKEKVLLRKSLTAFQFATATIACTGAIIISQQINLFLSKDLGYDKEYVVSAQLPRDWSSAGVDKMITMRNQFAALPGVESASLSYEIPDGNNIGQSYVYRQGRDTSTATPMQVLICDEQYSRLYKIPLASGAFFDGNKLDSGKMILNNAAAQQLGYKNAEEAIGQQIRAVGDPTVFVIKGITNDFHFGSMQQKVSPVVMYNVQFAPAYRYFSFKLKRGNISAAIQSLQQQWATLLPGAPFEYTFMDDTLATLYKSEIQLKKASYTATVLALIIVLLGVLGLVSLSIQKRTKEIGIRKVLGASVPAIVTLFVKEFLLVILIGGAVACPLAYILMHNWLQGYAYRITITATPFISSMVLLGVITALLICLQTIKAAVTNPVSSLRTE